MKSSFSQLIKMSCAKAGISQGELAKRMNISPALLSNRIKTGKFSYQDWQNIETALGDDVHIAVRISFPDGTTLE